MKLDKCLRYICGLFCVIGVVFFICFLATNYKYTVNISIFSFFLSGILAYLEIGRKIKNDKQNSMNIKHQNIFCSEDYIVDMHNQEIKQNFTYQRNASEEWKEYYKTKSMLTTLELIVVFIAVIVYVIASAIK